ncbi:magnesium citrate secondary transporter [Pontibacter sp. MBLB2868]|uniref:magnesium citrate secondary transporter n=1 Tax=Pontibacter sp. MBLB2868 TaxID=3451555 RepID=UPI003F756974
MKALFHPVFLLCLFVFGLNQLLEHAQVFIKPLHTHLDDLLCLPIILTIILAAERAYFQNPYFRLPWHYTLLALLSFTVVFEVILPAFSDRYTADALDIIAYSLGAVIFNSTINQPYKLAEKQ